MSRYTNDDGTIKWTKQDEERLKKAINNFKELLFFAKVIELAL